MKKRNEYIVQNLNIIKENNMLKGKQKELDKNEDGELSAEDFKMLRKMEDGGKVGNTCKGGGAALRGTKFVGVR